MDKKTLYECDPKRNTTCKKKGCAFTPGVKYPVCFATSHVGYARVGEDANGKFVTELKRKYLKVD